MRQKNYAGTIKTLLLIAIIFSSITMMVLKMTKAEPEGGSVNFIMNSTKTASNPGSRADNKGTINTILLNTVQQNIKWKAYVGNVSGTLVLRDAEDFSIYEWASGGNPDGEVYITRNSSIDWGTIKCANETSITTEETSLGHSSTAVDNINNTFSYRIHEPITVGTTVILASTCKSTATWINNTAQVMTATPSTYFPEVLLMDNNIRLVYTTLIDQNINGYRNRTLYDFQSIVPDYTSALIATYYFYVEISG